MACCTSLEMEREVSGVTDLEVAEAPFPLRVRKVVDVTGGLLEIAELHVPATPMTCTWSGRVQAVVASQGK